MKVVYKYALIPGASTVAMHVGATALHVAEQHGFVILWVEVDPDMPLVDYAFEVYGTGQPLVEPTRMLDHIGTSVGPEFVWHVYLRTAP